MKVRLNYASQKEEEKILEINTMEELKALSNKVGGYPIIFSNDEDFEACGFETPFELTVYDDYLE